MFSLGSIRGSKGSKRQPSSLSSPSSPGSPDSEKFKEVGEKDRSPLAVFKENRKSKEEKAIEKLQKKQEQEERKRKEKEEKLKKKEKKKEAVVESADKTLSSVGSPDSARDRSIGEELKQSTAHTKEYEYTDEDYATPKKPVQGFSYEKSGADSPSDGGLSPSSGKRLTAVGFNYAPGEIDKLAKGKIDYVESAAKKELESDVLKDVISPVKAQEAGSPGFVRLVEVVVNWRQREIVPGQVNPKTGVADLKAIAKKVKKINSKKEQTVKLLLSQDSTVVPGQIDLKTKEYCGYFDPTTGLFHPVSWKQNGEPLERVPSLTLQKDLKVIDVLVDPKTYKILDKQVDLNTSAVDLDSINSQLSNFDVSQAQPVKLLISSATKCALSGQIDPLTGEYLGYFDPKSGLFVPGGSQVSANENSILRGKDSNRLEKIDVLVEPKTSKLLDNQIDYQNGTVNLKGIADTATSDNGQYVPVSIVYNPVSNSVLFGQVDLQSKIYTGKLYPKQETNFGFRQLSIAVDTTNSKVLDNQVDLTTGQLNFEGIGENYKDAKGKTFVPVLVINKSNTLLAGQVNDDGEYLGHYDPDTLQFVPVKIDPQTGEMEEIRILNFLDVDMKDLKVIQVIAERGSNRILANQITPQTGELNGSGVNERIAKINPALHQRVNILTSPADKIAVAGQFNPKTMKYLGVFDPDTLRLTPLENQVPVIESEIVTFVHIKIDPKTGKVISGQIDPKNGQIQEQAVDLNTGRNKLAADGDKILVVVDKPTRKVLGGQIDLKHAEITSIVDPVTWEWFEVVYDSKKSLLTRVKTRGVLDPVTGILYSQSPELEDISPLPVFEPEAIIQAIEVQIDPKSGKLLDNVIDPKTGLVNASKFDLETGRLLNPADRRKVITSHVLIVKTSRKVIPGQIEPKHGKIVGKIDPASFKLVHVDFDPKSGNFVEGKVKGQLNPASGTVLEYEVDKLGKLKDPKSGKVIDYEIDPISGVLVDPKTGQSLVGQIGDTEGGIATTPKLEKSKDFDEGIKEGEFPYGGAGDALDPNQTFIVNEQSSVETPEKRGHGFGGISAIFGKEKKKAKKEKEEKKPKDKKKPKKVKKDGEDDGSSSDSDSSDSGSSSALSDYGEGQEEAKELKTSTKLRIPKLHLKGKEKSPGSPKEEKPKTKIPKLSGWKTSPSSAQADERPKSPDEKAAVGDAGSPKSSKFASGTCFVLNRFREINFRE